MRNSIKTFGLALMAACSLMAVFAVAAQAENLSTGGTAGSFSVLGSSALVAGATFGGTALHGILLIGTKNAYILCTEGHITGKGLSASEILVEVLYLGCEAFNDTTKALLAACPIENKDIKATAIGKAKLHEGKPYILFESEKEKVFAEVKFTGGECGIGVTVKVSGSVVAEVDNLNAAADHLITFSEAIQKLFQVSGVGDKLLYGAAEAFIAGPSAAVPTTVAHVKLTGTHVNCTWAVD